MTDAELIEADLNASPLATPGTFEALSRIVARVKELENQNAYLKRREGSLLRQVQTINPLAR